jgi:predicted O-methyltransferase YrrM
MVDKLYIMRDQSNTNGLIDLINYIKKHGNTNKMSMIEIGSYAGESTQIFANEFESVISIDPYINDYDPNDVTCSYMELEKVYNVFKEVVNRNDNIEHIRMTSDDAVKSLTNISVDFIYIDGLHTYEQIKKDITNYLPLLKPNCLIGGHDYHRNWGGVIKGIHELLGEPDAIFSDSSWIKLIK